MSTDLDICNDQWNIHGQKWNRHHSWSDLVKRGSHILFYFFQRVELICYSFFKGHIQMICLLFKDGIVFFFSSLANKFHRLPVT